MMNDRRIQEVQRLYPLLYYACHDSHAREDGLSESDLRLLHHIEAIPGTFASALSRHLDLSRSRLSEALGALEDAGLIERTPDGAGRKRIRLTREGEDALEARDGLDPRSIGVILDRLGDEEQEKVVEGLRLLADAIRDGQQ